VRDTLPQFFEKLHPRFLGRARDSRACCGDSRQRLRRRLEGSPTAAREVACVP
jgi:hypothetical protein